MEYSRRVTAATAQTPQLPKLGAQSRRRKLAAADLMKSQEYPMRITMFALSASMRPAQAQSMCRQATFRAPMLATRTMWSLHIDMGMSLCTYRFASI